MQNFGNKLRNFIRKSLRSQGYIFPERMNYKKFARLFYFHDLYQQIENLEGAVVECGVAYGDSIVVFAALAEREGKKRKVFGFDSFAGFPEPAKEDVSSRNPKAGEFGDATLTRVKNQIQKAGVPMPTLVKGFVKDTLPSFNEPIAFLHIDVDLYEPYKDVLNNLYGHVVSGGVIAFDEYNHMHWPGAKRAVDEFVAHYSLTILHDAPSGKYFVIKP